MRNIHNIFKKFYKKTEEEKEWDVFVDWLSGHIKPEEYVLVLKNESLYKLFFKTHFKIGDKPEMKDWVSDGRSLPSFILLAKGRERQLPLFLTKDWYWICEGFFYDLYENISRFGNRFLPLRFGLLPEEKNQAIRIARLALEKFLKNGERPCLGEIKDGIGFNKLPRRFFIPVDLDVAIWIRGRMRGSCVVEGKELYDGIIEAVIGASQDSRFKPLNLNELQDARIEITLMLDTRVPLPQSLIKKNELLADKGFVLQNNGKTGWFLPEVFNVRRFRNLNEFLVNLATEKAGLARNAWWEKEIRIEIFRVEDFIENEAHSDIYNLCGPIISSKIEASRESFKKRMCLAADWLVNIQEPDGNFPSVIDPLTGRQTQIDWPRSAFCGLVLAEFGLAVNNKKYIEASEKYFQYFNAYFKRGLALPIYNSLLTCAYAGQQALAFYKNRQQSNFYLAARDFAQEILNNGHKLNFEPVVFQQIASFFAEFASFKKDFLNYAQEFAKISRENFEKSLRGNVSMNLASQAELVNVHFTIFKLTNNSEELKFAIRVADWLLLYQLIQGPGGAFGPFAAATDSSFVYSRGTGKILEILPFAEKAAKELNLPFEQYHEDFKKAIAWLSAMQYTEENTFFVPKEIRPKIWGGFRHDYFNQEAWIDAAGHFILGAIRFLMLQEEEGI